MADWTDFTDGRYTLTAAGRTLLEENREAVELLFSASMERGQQAAVAGRLAASNGHKGVLYDENVTVSEGELTQKDTPTRRRSALLRRAAIEHYTQPDGSLPCAACGFDFRARYGALGEGYIQIHHETPLFQYEDEGAEAFLHQAVRQVKPLCANCHSMIHRDRKHPLTVEALKALLRP